MESFYAHTVINSFVKGAATETQVPNIFGLELFGGHVGRNFLPFPFPGHVPKGITFAIGLTYFQLIPKGNLHLHPNPLALVLNKLLGYYFHTKCIDVDPISI